MEILLLVVETGSLSAAARKHRLPLATVSRKLAALERKLGASLLLRGQRRVTLTEVGRAYVAAIRPALAQLKEAEQVAAGEFREPLGELAVTAPVLFGRRYAAPLVMTFLRQHATIRGRLLLTDRHVNLREERIDVAIRIGEVEDPTLIAVNVGSVRRVICASPAYLAQRGRPRSPEDLGSHDAILFDGYSSAPTWSLVRGAAAVTVQPAFRLVVNDTEAAVDGAVAGFGLVRVLSYQVDDLLKTGALTLVLNEFEPAPIPVRLVYVDREPLPRKIRAFVDWSRPRLRERLARVTSA